MSHDFVQRRVIVYPSAEAALTTNLITFSTTGVKAVFNFATAIEVISWGVVFDNNAAVTPGTGVIALQKYLAPGNASGLVALSTITPSNATGVAVGSVVRNRLQGTSGTSGTGSDGSATNVAPRLQPDFQASQQNNFIVREGQQLVVNVTTAMTAGQGQVFVEYVERPMVKYDALTASAYIEVSA